MTALAAVHDSPRQSTAPQPEARLSAALHQLRMIQRRRSQVVVASDFLGDDAWAGPLRALARHHEIVAVHVTDPRELELPAVGIIALVDTETGRQRYVQSSSAGLRARYAAAATERHKDIRVRIESTGAAYLHLSTDRDWLTDTVRFATGLRRMQRRGPSQDAITRFTTVVAR